MQAIDKNLIRLIFINWFLFSWVGQKVPYFGVPLGCLEGVWDVSGGCLSDCGYCQGGYDVQTIDKYPIRLIFIKCYIISQLPRNGQNVPYFGVSLGPVSGECLGGVWGLS